MRVLIVDDDTLVAAVTAAILEDGGCDVVSVETADEAFDIMVGGPWFDAVVCDMNMPGMSGLDLFRTLRAHGNGTPFVLLSGDDPQSLLSQEPGLAACVAKDRGLETALMSAVADALSPVVH